MKTKKRINAAYLIAAASLTFSPSAWSLGLGDATVESFLNQPLQVKIDLISRETDDMTSVTARLASASDYEMIGASRESISVPIQFAVEDIDGDAYILATSSLAVSNPVVRLIVEVNWSSGRLLREYTVFLDPPTVSDSAPIPRMDQRRVPSPVASATPVQPEETPADTSPQARAGQATTTKPSASDTAAREPADGEYGPVGNGETLWGIASNWSRGTGLEINQVMIAIQQENPQAFLRNNINLLKRGAILRMPRAEDVRAISAASANQAVSTQQDELRGRTSMPATAASTSTPLLSKEAVIPEAQDVSQGLDEGFVEEELAAEESVSEDLVSEEAAVSEPELSPQLELVPPSEDSELDSAYGFEESEDGAADATVAVAALREDLARTEEDLVTQQQQNEYLAERIRELESQLESTEQGNVESSDMANMEDRLREQRAAEAAAAQNEETPWYSRLSGWLIGLLILAAAVAGWWFSRRKAGADDQQIREITDEAEELLRVLDDSETPETSAEADDAEAGADDADKNDKSDQPENDAVVPEKQSPRSSRKDDADAEVLDEESSDPEIQLDLARAYISMGDKEAARVILEEVSSHGNEEQQKEAKKMLDLLIP